MGVAVFIVAAMGFGYWVAIGGAGDDKEVSDTVRKIAAALEKKDTAEAKKLAKAVADKEEIEDVMHVLSLRRAKGLGVGPTPGKINPDGIEAKIIDLSGKKAMAPEQLNAEADALVQMAYIAAAVGEIANAKPPAQDDNKKKKSDWLKWSAEMRDSALEFAGVAKGKNPEAVKKGATKLLANCTTCHDVFKP
jgi:hypothetical protein